MADFDSLQFDWDEDKASRNLRAHGVSFEEAKAAFADPLNAVKPDRAHSEGEERFVLLGESDPGRLLVVVHSMRNSAIRIISASLQTGASVLNMNVPHPEDPDIMLEYDFSGPDVVRGKYAKYFIQGRTVILDADNARRFPDSKSVNDALRGLAQLADSMPAQKPKRRSKAKATA